MSEKISIVIPIYNVEKYIDNCIESVINQTYTNIEIILVDDGSPDNCPIICDNWSKKDNRVVVVHKKNGGLSDARNQGIKKSTGKYICFIDSDDYVENNYIEKLYNSLLINKTDISQCGIKYVDSNGNYLYSCCYNEDIIKTNIEMILDSFNKHNIDNVVAWNRLYKKSLFDKLLFPVGKIHEDEFTTYKLLYNVNKISIVSDCLYNYRQTNGSITRSKFNIKRLDVLEALKEKITFFDNKNEYEITKLCIQKYLNCSIDNFYLLSSKNSNEKQKKHELKCDIRSNLNKYKKKYNIACFKFYLFLFSPFLFRIFKKIKNLL